MTTTTITFPRVAADETIIRSASLGDRIVLLQSALGFMCTVYTVRVLRRIPILGLYRLTFVDEVESDLAAAEAIFDTVVQGRR